MPCRVDVCVRCGEYECPGLMDSSRCIYPGGKAAKATPKNQFDTAGALCDVLCLLEEKFPDALKVVDTKTLSWWHAHEQQESDKIKRDALAKLSTRERRILGLK